VLIVNSSVIVKAWQTCRRVEASYASCMSRPTLWCCYCTLLLKADQSADLTCWSLRNITQLTNAIRKLRRPITGSSAQCSHHCMSSLQLLTSWTRDVDHRADTGSGWTDHSKHDCRTRDRCKANSDNVLTILLFVWNVYVQCARRCMCR